MPTEYYVNIKAYRGSTGVDPVILNFDTRWRSEVNFMPQPLYLRARTRYPLNTSLVGPHSWSGRFGEEKNLPPLSGFEPRTVQPVVWVAMPNALSLLVSSNN